ncbi:MAG: TIR domain-containing protein [Bacteroidales bacterium]|nr:TIR domain-containing protein [Bacteroidales bacterium]
MRKNIFISYRHKDVDFARSLSYALRHRGFKEVFLDYNNIKDGDYKQVIDQALRNTSILILILGDEIFTKCNNPNDILRQELETAINLGITIIPVNPNSNFTYNPQDLPSHIHKHIESIQISEIHRGALFESSVNTLIKDRIRPNITIIRKSIVSKLLQKHRNTIYPLIAILFILLILSIILHTHSGYGLSETNNGYIPIEMQYIHGDTFAMGINQENAFGPLENATPKHIVYIDDYIIGKYEITQAQWKVIMKDNPSNPKGDSLPVNNISWDDCQLFIAKLNATTGLTYRLPSEAEWEYAALGGDKNINTKSYSGNQNIRKVAWYGDNSDKKCQNVGKLLPNGYGLFDMSGNVEEWCEDYYDQYFPNDSLTIFANPIIYKWGECKVHRGGNYNSDSQNCHIRNRNMHKHNFKSPRLGVRLALQIPIELSQLKPLQFNKNGCLGQPIELANVSCIITNNEIRKSILNHKIRYDNKVYCKTNSEETLVWLKNINCIYGLKFRLPTIEEFNQCKDYLDKELISHGVWCYDTENETIIILRNEEIIPSYQTSRALIYIKQG